jgi:hypothetical protein
MVYWEHAQENWKLYPHKILLVNSHISITHNTEEMKQPNVHQLMNARTKGGLPMQWNIIW